MSDDKAIKAISLSTLRWRIRIILRQIWVRVTAFGLLGVLTALASAGVGYLIPDELSIQMGVDSVEPILKIIATAMLTVTTFSLQIMVTAFGSAQTAATPRAVKLMQSDRITQNVLASFIGAFVFSLVGIIALETGIYGPSGRFLLLLVTIGVVAIVVISLLRWVQHLSEFGRLGDVIGRVEIAADAALRSRCADPWLGGQPWQDAPVGVWSVSPDRTGHVQYVDISKLQAVAEEQDCRIWICARPGVFVHRAADLVLCDALPQDAHAHAEMEERLLEAFAVNHDRDFEQDPQFGLIALAEIASRALSPGINDPGTGIDILGRLVRVLASWHPPHRVKARHDRVYVSDLPPAQLLEDAFSAIARDGAGQFEVAWRLQQVLSALADMEPDHFGRPAAEQALRAAEQAESSLPLAEDRARIHENAQALKARFLGE
ncbi:hypothetical protein DL1_07605 [Thioclava dalianensis]|uniref:DUF2254 domain-containing protein n=1 Tax=Thioclava dalianensis TaxID=1185766 RepID=A0A074TIG5_9RHOB|nr:DUF2254 domain-containing protein [Thioclava dalianensis]KEP71439.1 hypothetical protein DL1_07605 [Thioclava dalianensis]SFM80061.1 Uncharacterized membrane protein [Thioclava dalianensis]